MTHRSRQLLVVAVTLMLGSLWAQAPLSREAQQVVDYLLKDWGERMHSTGIAQAMTNLGLEPDDQLRLQVGEHLRANTELHLNLRSWGANNYLLSDEEKRLAKFLIAHFEATQEMPTIDQMGTELEIEPSRLSQRMAFLQETGFLQPAADATYRLSEKYLRWGGPLRFNYHTITIGDEDPFAVW